MRLRHRTAASSEDNPAKSPSAPPSEDRRSFALRYTGWLVGLGIFFTVAVAAVGVFGAPHWFVHGGLKGLDRVTAQNDIRDTWLKLSAGVAVAFAAVVTLGRLELSKSEHEIAKSQERRALDQQQLELRQYATDLFSRAVEQLGNQAVDVRLGGIYALEKTHRASSEDRAAIVEVLAAYVRSHLSPRGLLPEIPEDQRPAPLPVDIQAALTVLGRLHHLRLDLPRIDASARSQYRADLTKGDFTSANLFRANFHSAYLNHTNLTGATLIAADLTGAGLTGAILTRANLKGANLTGAILTRANFTGAKYDQFTKWPDGFDVTASGAVAAEDTDP